MQDVASNILMWPWPDFGKVFQITFLFQYTWTVFSIIFHNTTWKWESIYLEWNTGMLDWLQIIKDTLYMCFAPFCLIYCILKNHCDLHTYICGYVGSTGLHVVLLLVVPMVLNLEHSLRFLLGRVHYHWATYVIYVIISKARV